MDFKPKGKNAFYYRGKKIPKFSNRTELENTIPKEYVGMCKIFRWDFIVYVINAKIVNIVGPVHFYGPNYSITYGKIDGNLIPYKNFWKHPLVVQYKVESIINNEF